MGQRRKTQPAHQRGCRARRPNIYRRALGKIISRLFGFFHYFWPPKGSVAEWLGTGLQNQLQRFESARNLRTRKAPLHEV